MSGDRPEHDSPGTTWEGIAEGDRGTPLAAWERWDRDALPAPLAGPDTWGSLVVVAPHPDDEILGVGALAARVAAAGRPVTVLALTDGQASHPGSPTLGPDELAGLRIAESADACAALGLPTPLRLGLEDGGLAGAEERVTAAVTAAVGAGAGVRVAVTWRGDGHPDHEAAGRAAARACAATGATLVEYPVWTWHWARPGDARVPWDRRRVLHLTDAELAAKRRAVECFATQIRPLSPDPRDQAILPPWILERLLRPVESVLV